MANHDQSIYEKLRRAGNGMLNTFQFIGPLLQTDYAKGTFALSLHPKDERRRIDMNLGRIVLPHSLKPGQQARVNGYVRATLEDGVRKLRFHPISVRDCLDLSHFNEAAQQQWIQAAARSGKSEDPPFRINDETFQAIRHNFYGNSHVGLEGFIKALLYRPGETADGSPPKPPCLHLLLRQFENDDLNIPVRLYGRSLDAKASMQTILKLHKQALNRGRLMPVKISGRAEVDIKDVPTTGQEEGVETRITPIIKVERLRMITPEDYRRFIPHEVMDRETKATKVVDFYPWANVQMESANTLTQEPEVAPENGTSKEQIEHPQAQAD